MGETCDWPLLDPAASLSLIEFGPSIALGVGGTPAVAFDTFPINHDGTQPLSPPSSFTACTCKTSANQLNLGEVNVLHMTNDCIA